MRLSSNVPFIRLVYGKDVTIGCQSLLMNMRRTRIWCKLRSGSNSEVKNYEEDILSIMGLCSILGVATACNEDPEYFTLDEQPDEMHIVASTISWCWIKERKTKLR